MIFVLGGRGFVGSAIARELEARLAAGGEEFAVIDRANYGSFAGTRCRLFINANGNSRKPLAKQAPLEDFDASVRSVRSTLVDFPCERYVLLSSCDVYPDCSSPERTREDAALDAAAQSPYGFHKHLAEQCVRHGAPDHLIFRMGGFVGPGLKKNAIFDIVHGGPLWLDPQSELQFLDTGEAARLLLDLASRAPARETFNLCGRGVIRLQEVMDAAGGEIRVQPDSPRVRYDVSIEKISGWCEIPETRRAVLDFVQNPNRRSKL